MDPRHVLAGTALVLASVVFPQTWHGQASPACTREQVVVDGTFSLKSLVLKSPIAEEE